MTIAEQRRAVVAEAMTWLRTPYHPCARVKGAGLDCAMLLPETYEAVGLMDHAEFGHYSPDWHLHHSEEIYLNHVLTYCDEIDGPPEPGDIVMWRFGRCFSHGAIVVAWPQIIHAYIRRPVSLDDAEINQTLKFIGEPDPERGKLRPRRFFCPKVWR